MAWVAAGTFAMGSEDFYPEERPVREVAVDGFWIDVTPVTVAQFRRFVRATGWVTVAERDLDPAPGSLVFHPTPGPVRLDDFRQWWSYVEGACWHRPEGPGSDTYTRARHPVVHVTPEDAEAYAAWAGAKLPTEAEWEYAASAGDYEQVNRWHGEFPWRGYRGTSPVGTFPPNDRGLIDMIGNVWEWTADPYGRTGRLLRRARRRRAAPRDQGRLAPVRAELLPPLSPRGAAGRGDRHLHEPHRLPLRRAALTAGAESAVAPRRASAR